MQTKTTDTRAAKLSRAVQAIRFLCHGIQEMYTLNFLSILSNTCLKFPCGRCQLTLLQIPPPVGQGKCRKLFQRCRRETEPIGTSQQQNNTFHFPYPWLSILIHSSLEAVLQHISPTSSVCLSQSSTSKGHLRLSVECWCKAAKVKSMVQAKSPQ